MHIDWSFWGFLLGASTVSHMWAGQQQKGDELAKRLILLAGTGDDRQFFDVLSPYIGRFAGTVNSVWVSAVAAATQMQQLHDGQISSAPYVLRFRDWCRSIVL